MTVRRYYTDSYTNAFSARVVASSTLGGAPAAVLDETFFYPTSGGQPHDLGLLGPARVTDVVARADGTILHRLDTPVPEGPIEAQIDWARRLDHMQQHTGQHILSQAFLRIAEAPTTSFHLGAEGVSIDLGVPALGDASIADALALANRIVAGNAPVRAWFPAPGELAALSLRKTPEVDGPLRVVAIGEFDVSACGGTHVAATGEVGLIDIQKTERQKQGIRVEFLCGGRARADYARKGAIVRGLAAALTCSPGELAESVAKMQGALAEARRELALYRERDLDHEALGLLASAQGSGPIRIVRRAWNGRPVDELKGLMLRVTTAPGVVALFGAAGARTQLLFGKSEGVEAELRPAFNQALDSLGGGKGGGARLLQGAGGASGISALERVLETAEATIVGSR